jgi:hypothetical protein
MHSTKDAGGVHKVWLGIRKNGMGGAARVVETALGEAF